MTIDHDPDFTVRELAMLSAHGTPEQIERWQAQVLPEEELVKLARDVLFKPLEGLPRWNSRSNRRASSLQATDLAHPVSCPHHQRPREPLDEWRERLLAAGAVRFETTEAAEMSKEEWATYKKVTFLAACVPADELYVKRNTHWATCTMCANEMCRNTALVTVHWAGRVLSREYRIDMGIREKVKS